MMRCCHDGSHVPGTIMVVEDDTLIGEQLEAVLLEEGYVVEQARDGSQALEKLRGSDTPPDLILLDLWMPRMDGWEFRRAQLGDEEIRDIPVVVMTAMPGVATLDDLGAVTVLAKPLRLERLLGAVSASLGRSP